jgi:hypothetical protein
MRRKLKWLGIAVLAAVVVRAGWFGVGRGEGEAELLARKQYLVAALTGPRGGLDGMIAGEWELVSLSMTGLAAANLAFEHPKTRDQARRELASLCDRALEERVRAFDADTWGEDPLATLESNHGHIGYLGHLDLLLGTWRALGGDDPARVALHRDITRALARRMAASPSRYLETYPGAIWTADNAVVLAAIGLFDRVEGSDAHRALLDQQVAYTRAHLLDPRTGLVVFRVTGEGQPLGTSRGSGVGWNAIYLPFADEGFAREQAEALRRTMIKRLPLGCAGVREFPAGVSGRGDVDSGPVILEVSPSGTGFGIAALRTLGDDALAADLLDTAELAGATVQWNGERRYLVGPIVGDASVLAARTQRAWR